MVYHRFNIDFSLYEIKGSIISFPFYMVMQTKDRSIEEHCFKTYPRLMYETTQYDAIDRANQAKMERYIIKNFKESDKQEVHKFFYDKNWMAPLSMSARLTKITFNDFDCKIWTNPQVPFLEIKGQIHFDLNDILDYYIKRNLLSIKRDKKLTKEVVNLRFMRGLPFMLTYMTKNTVNEMIIEYFENKLNSRQKNYVLDKFVKLTKLKKFGKMKKEITWKDNHTIQVVIIDMLAVIGAKLKRNYIPLSAAGYIVYKNLQKNRNTQIRR